MKVKIYKNFNDKKRILKISFSDREAVDIYRFLKVKVSSGDGFLSSEELVERIKKGEELFFLSSSRWKDSSGSFLKFMRAEDLPCINGYRLDEFGSSNIQRKEMKNNISIIRAVPRWDGEKFVIKLDITSSPLMDEDVIFLINGFKALIDKIYKSHSNKYYAMDIKIKEI